MIGVSILTVLHKQGYKTDWLRGNIRLSDLYHRTAEDIREIALKIRNKVDNVDESEDEYSYTTNKEYEVTPREEALWDK